MRKVDYYREVEVFGKKYQVIDPIKYKFQYFVVEEGKVIAFTFVPEYDEEEQAWYVSDKASKNHRNHQVIGYAPNDFKLHDRDSMVFVEYVEDKSKVHAQVW